jgi:hypothetical protein
MKFRDLFKVKAPHNGIQQLNTRELDTFADNVIYELKTLISNAVAEALEEKESRYLRSILEESFFTLDTLVIKALDAATYRELEDFLSDHENINPSFRTEFFHQVVQQEYRSSRGSSVRATSELRPIFEVNPQHLDSETEDESFILSLKGRKVRFQIRAVLSGPTRKLPAPASPSATLQTPARAGVEHSTPQTQKPHTREHHVLITWQDKHGTHQKTLALPVLLGRETASQTDNYPTVDIGLTGTYVSRRQLVVLEILGQIYCYVPSDASLTCSTETGKVLRPDTLHKIEEGQPAQLTTGVPMNTTSFTGPRDKVSDYPKIDIQIARAQIPHDDATPRPRAVK